MDVKTEWVFRIIYLINIIVTKWIYHHVFRFFIREEYFQELNEVFSSPLFVCKLIHTTWNYVKEVNSFFPTLLLWFYFYVIFENERIWMFFKRICLFSLLKEFLYKFIFKYKFWVSQMNAFSVMIYEIITLETFLNLNLDSKVYHSLDITSY